MDDLFNLGLYGLNIFGGNTLFIDRYLCLMPRKLFRRRLFFKGGLMQ